jgi:hypothetical protein
MEQSERRRRTPGDIDVNGEDSVERSADHESTLEGSTADGTDARCHDELWIGHRLVGVLEGLFHLPRHHTRHEQRVGVARRRREEEPQPVKVVLRAAEELQFGLTSVARSGVHMPDVKRTPKEGLGTPLQLGDRGGLVDRGTRAVGPVRGDPKDLP